MSELPPETAVPALARGVKFRFDEVRQRWVLLAPERLFVPDDQAVEILKLVDGSRSLGGIIEDLAVRFKCNVLWSQLDALHHAYVTPGWIPPGAFKPETLNV